MKELRYSELDADQPHGIANGIITVAGAQYRFINDSPEVYDRLVDACTVALGLVTCVNLTIPEESLPSKDVLEILRAVLRDAAPQRLKDMDAGTDAARRSGKSSLKWPEPGCCYKCGRPIEHGYFEMGPQGPFHSPCPDGSVPACPSVGDSLAEACKEFAEHPDPPHNHDLRVTGDLRCENCNGYGEVGVQGDGYMCSVCQGTGVKITKPL